MTTEAQTTAVWLISSFGFSGLSFGKQNAVMIIAYYLGRRPDRNRFLEASARREDRDAICRWLMTVLVKRGLWVSPASLLSRARTAIQENCGTRFDSDAVASAMASTTGSMAFTDEEIEDLADTPYGDRSAYSLLSLLFPHIDTANHVFHIDRVFPRALMTSAKMDCAGLGDLDRKYISDGIDRLSNLQLLPGRENEKNSTMSLRQWMESDASTDDRHRDGYAREQELGVWRILPEDLRGFRDFCDARRRRILRCLKGLLRR